MSAFTQWLAALTAERDQTAAKLARLEALISQMQAAQTQVTYKSE